MQNKIFLLGMCLVLSMSNVYAKGTVIKSLAPSTQGQSCETQIESNTTLMANPCELSEDAKAPQEAAKYKKYIKHVEQERATVYNALNLTDEQIQIRENLIKENAPLYEQKFDSLIKESFKLKALRCANVSERELAKQRRVIKKIRNSIDDMLEKENKCFEKSLTRQQRSKYSMIKRLERLDYKRDAKRKDYYKSNPQMVPFGNPRPYTSPIGREEN